MANDKDWFEGTASRILRLNYSANFEFGVERISFSRMQGGGENQAVGFESRDFGNFHEKLSGGQSLMVGEDGSPAYFNMLFDGEMMTEAVGRFDHCIERF